MLYDVDVKLKKNSIIEIWIPKDKMKKIEEHDEKNKTKQKKKKPKTYKQAHNDGGTQKK